MKNKGFAPVEVIAVICVIASLWGICLIIEKQTKIGGARLPAAYQCVNGLLLQQNKAVMANGQPVKC